LEILFVVPVVRATESPEVDANKGAIGEPFGSHARLSVRLPFRNGEDLSYGAVTQSPSGEPSASELNQKLTNPVSDLWSIANQFNNFELNNGHWNNNWNFQPVLPIGLTKDWNLITRPVMPFYNIVPHETAPDQFERAAGLGDLTLLELLSPAHSGNWVLGAGPTFIFPTATSHFTGQGKWQMGPSVVVAILSWCVSTAMVVYRRRARPARHEPDEPPTHRHALLRRWLEHRLLGQYLGGLERAVSRRLDGAYRAQYRQGDKAGASARQA
jgi:hypothetical protein